MQITNRFAVTLAAVIAAAGAHADVVLSNLPATLPTNGSGIGVNAMTGFHGRKAIQFRTGGDRTRLERVSVYVTNAESSISTAIIAGVYDDNAGEPGALLLAFDPIPMSPMQPSTRLEFPAPQIYNLEPDTVYWVVLDASASDELVYPYWQRSEFNIVPTTDAFTHLGYAYTSDGGSTWSSTGVNTFIEIEAPPTPELSNLGSVPMPAGGGPLLDANNSIAAVLTTDSQTYTSAHVSAALRGELGDSEITGSVFDDDAGDLGALLGSSPPVTVSASAAAEYEFVVSDVTLSPNTPYWFVLSRTGGLAARWQTMTPHLNPAPAPGFGFGGFRSSIDGGSTWTVSPDAYAIDIDLVPHPILFNLTGDPPVAGTMLGGSIFRTKAVGFTTGNDALGCLEMRAMISNEHPSITAELSGSIRADAGGQPGAMLTQFEPLDIPPNSSPTPTEVIAFDRFFSLDPNTAYWFVLNGSPGSHMLEWHLLDPALVPATAPGITFDGYLFDSTSTATWVTSNAHNAVSIAARAPADDACPADIDADGDADPDDIAAFVTNFTDAIPANADIDNDGDEDPDDIAAFVNAFVAGC